MVFEINEKIFDIIKNDMVKIREMFDTNIYLDVVQIILEGENNIKTYYILDLNKKNFLYRINKDINRGLYLDGYEIKENNVISRFNINDKKIYEYEIKKENYIKRDDGSRYYYTKLYKLPNELENNIKIDLKHIIIFSEKVGEVKNSIYLK